jgi:hypothetical protein
MLHPWLVDWIELREGKERSFAFAILGGRRGAAIPGCLGGDKTSMVYHNGSGRGNCGPTSPMFKEEKR